MLPKFAFSRMNAKAAKHNSLFIESCTQENSRQKACPKINKSAAESHFRKNSNNNSTFSAICQSPVVLKFLVILRTCAMS